MFFLTTPPLPAPRRSGLLRWSNCSADERRASRPNCALTQSVGPKRIRLLVYREHEATSAQKSYTGHYCSNYLERAKIQITLVIRLLWELQCLQEQQG